METLMPPKAVDRHASPNGFLVSHRRVGDTAVLTCRGTLGRQALGGCAVAMADVVADGALRVVAEVEGCPVTGDTLSLLVLMRRYANRHGLDFTVVVPDADGPADPTRAR
jgi:hypothetical protein